MNDQFLIWAFLFILCLAARAVYELLKETHKIDLESKPIFAGILTAMCILWVSWFNLCPTDPYQTDLPAPIRWVGLATFIIGTILAVGALIQLRGVENIDHLVTTGLFRKIRHPMYVGFICWFLGWSIFQGGMLSLAMGAIGAWNVLWWKHLEERRLGVQFGEKYQQYHATTWC
jgi:protein-S-isoprenylcysteine O-methyltransferase Ste14